MSQDKILTYGDYRDERLELRKEYQDPYQLWLMRKYQEYQSRTAPAVPNTLQTTAHPEVNCGRWLWRCVACASAVPVEDGQPVICVECGTGGWQAIAWPDNRSAIEQELLRQPGFRQSAPIRSWQRDWTVEDLEVRTAKAQAKINAGEPFPDSLSIGATRTWTVGEILTAANMNTHISNLFADLAGRDGVIELENSVEVAGGSNRYLRVPLLTSAQRASLTPSLGRVVADSGTSALYFGNGNDFDTLGKDLKFISASNVAGTANAITLAPELSAAEYGDGDTYAFVAEHRSTGSVTVNVSSLGAKEVYVGTNRVSSGTIHLGDYVELVYLSGVDRFQIVAGEALARSLGGGLMYASRIRSFNESSVAASWEQLTSGVSSPIFIVGISARASGGPKEISLATGSSGNEEVIFSALIANGGNLSIGLVTPISIPENTRLSIRSSTGGGGLSGAAIMYIIDSDLI